jgi:hypothetical protein
MHVIGLFDIPKPDSKSPIIIFIDPEIDAALKVLPFNGYPFKDFGFFTMTIPYLKRYPKVAVKKKRRYFLMYVHLLPSYAYMQSPYPIPSQLFKITNHSK